MKTIRVLVKGANAKDHTIQITEKDRIENYVFAPMPSTFKLIPEGGFTKENCAVMDKFFKNTLIMAWCHRCGRVWMKRMLGRPSTCPSCRTFLWDKPPGARERGPRRKG